MFKVKRLIVCVFGILSAFVLTRTASADWWRPVPGASWQIQYTGALNTALDVQVFNIDLFDVSQATIAKLHAQGKKVICYFSAGSFEDWRADANRFPHYVRGRNLNGWPGEAWLDIRRLDILMPIMAERMKLGVQKGCDAVDPDNVDGYSNQSGFRLSYDDQINYNMALAETAHRLGLGVSLKNDLDQVEDLVDHFDFAVNEECFSYQECDLLLPFISAGKPVFGIEYRLSEASFCRKANKMNFDFLRKRLELDAWRVACR